MDDCTVHPPLLFRLLSSPTSLFFCTCARLCSCTHTHAHQPTNPRPDTHFFSPRLKPHSSTLKQPRKCTLPDLSSNICMHDSLFKSKWDLLTFFVQDKTHPHPEDPTCRPQTVALCSFWGKSQNWTACQRKRYLEEAILAGMSKLFCLSNRSLGTFKEVMKYHNISPADNFCQIRNK